MQQITILNQNNEPQGPFTRAEVASRLQSGQFTLSNLAFVEGLSQWTPLREVLAKIDGTSVVPAPALAAPGIPAAYSYAATMQPPAHLVYAGFWIRFVAYLIDTFILTAAVTVIFVVLMMIMGVFGAMLGFAGHGQSGNSDAATALTLIVGVILEFVIWAVVIVGFWLYFAKMESGPHQATFGKRALGLRVTNMAGERVSFGQATGRTFGKFLSGMILDIGFIMAAFTDKKQALHDMIAGTLVVKN